MIRQHNKAGSTIWCCSSTSLFMFLYRKWL